MGDLVEFPIAACITRAIVVEPFGAANEDACRAVPWGFPSIDVPGLDRLTGPLIYVANEARYLGTGLPVLISSEARRRAFGRGRP